jgi:TetR/AcrR family transcriptional regulator, cholesterol catabolism regulator
MGSAGSKQSLFSWLVGGQKDGMTGTLMEKGNRVRTKDTKPETAQKLIEVAIDLFSTGGFEGTSIRHIAKALGMTISSIYYYFGNKDGLLFAILEYSHNRLMATLRGVTERDMDPVERFKLLVRTHYNYARVNEKEVKVFFLEEEPLSTKAKELKKKFQLDILNIYRGELENLRELGQITYKDTTILAFNVLGMIHGLTVVSWRLRLHHMEDPASIDELAEETIADIFYGLHGSPPSVAEKVGGFA